MKKILTVVCLLAMLLGMIAVPAVTAEAATETFYAGYGIANITPAYEIKTVKVSSTGDLADKGTNDKGTVSLKVITDPIIFASYGTAESRMGQEYLPDNSYLADGTSSGENRLYFTKVDGLDSKYDSDGDGRPQYQIVDGDMFVTCIALRYGASGEPLLLIAVDMSAASEGMTAEIRTRIKEAVPGIDPSRIMVSASHTHSSPTCDSSNENNKAWAENIFYPGIVDAALRSIDDLSKADIKTTTVCATDAEKVGGTYYISEEEDRYINNSDSVPSSIENFNYDASKKNVDTRLQYMSAVRHYKYQTYACKDCGQSYVRTDNASDTKWEYNYEEAYQKWEGAPCSDDTCTGKVTLVTRYYGDSFWTRAEGICAPTSMVVNVKQAYQDMHIIKFDRVDPKKDIVLLNWRAHPHQVGSETSSVLSCDLSGAFRDALSGVRNITTGAYVTGAARYEGEDVSSLDCLVSYYQGAAGNINEISHDRVNGNNAWSQGTAYSSDESSYYYDRDKKVSRKDLISTDYYDQGTILADIAYDALNTSGWWTDAAEGEINMIGSTYTSDKTDLSLQIAQMSNMAAHKNKSELAKYQYLYNTVLQMRELWNQRNNKTRFADIQACRRAIIALDPSHVINGIYHANKIYDLLNEHAVDGEFTEASLEKYKDTISTRSEEVDTILIGDPNATTKQCVAIVTAPHELFDTTGQQIEKLGKDLGITNLKILNFCYSNGANGYVPNQEAWLYETTIAEAADPDSSYYDAGFTYYFSASPYEANTCTYKIGTAEGIVEAARAMVVNLTTTARANHCACEGNGTGFYHNTDHVCDFDAWTALSANADSLELKNGDKIQLTEDVTVTDLQLAAGTTSAMICLNGHTLSLGGTVNVSVGETLAICGCEASRRGRIVNAPDITTQLFTVGEGELLIFGGVLSGSERHRVLYTTQATGGVYMFGGSIADGNTSLVANSGNVTMANGEFWLYGGEITGGNTKWNNDAIDGVTDGASKVHGAGGNVFIQKGVFSQYGGAITGGTAALSGGNVFMSGGEYEMRGGTISGGTATPTEAGLARNQLGAGGNVYVSGGTFTQRGGVISGGTATRCGGNVYSAGTFNMDEYESFGRHFDKANITGGTVTGLALTPRSKALTAGLESGKYATCANGGNIYASGAFWMYNGEVTDGVAGIDRTTGEKTLAAGGASGGNIYGTSTVRIGGSVSGGAAITRGNNLYVNSGMVANLEGGHFTDDAAYAQKAPENVNINDAKTVKLVGDCQIIGGKYAIRIRSVSAGLTDSDNNTDGIQIGSETPETGVWVDAVTDETTGEVFAPVFQGDDADIVLVDLDGTEDDSYLCFYDGFRNAVPNYYYRNGMDRDGNAIAADNRITLLVEDMDVNTPYPFARKAITYNKVVTESTDDQGNKTTVTTYEYKTPSVQLDELHYCFKPAEGQPGSVSKNLGGILSAPTTPDEVKQQWLELTAYVACSVIKKANGEIEYGVPKTLQQSLTYYATEPTTASGERIAVQLLCSVDATGMNLEYTGTRDLVIDLNGYDLTWPVITMPSDNVELACIDSTTNDYNCYWEDDVKVKFGTLYTNSSVVKGATLTDGKLENSTSGDLEAVYKHNGRWYLRVAEGQNSNGVKGYSFHRIYMNLTGISIYPRTDGIAYSSAFLSNARVRNKLRDQGALCPEGRGFGIMVTASGGAVETNSMFVTYNKNYIVIPEGTESGGAGEFTNQSLADLAYKTSRIDNFLAPYVDADGNVLLTTEQKATTTLTLTPTVVLEDGTYLAVGNPVTRTYKEQIGKANAAWTAGQLSQSLQDAMYTMYRNYMDTMSQWEDQYVSNMRGRYYDESSVDKPLDNEQDGDPWA